MKHKTITVKSICKKLLIKIEGFSATIIKHFPERVENQLEIIKSFNLKCNASVKCFMRTLWIMRLVLVIWHNIIATESKNFNMRGVGVFFHWRRGGILMGRLSIIGCEGGFNLKNWIVYMFFLFLNFARLYSYMILTVLWYVCITI